ncbi:MAG: DUF4012 domain-containing protein [bacterium]
MKRQLSRIMGNSKQYYYFKPRVQARVTYHRITPIDLELRDEDTVAEEALIDLPEIAPVSGDVLNMTFDAAAQPTVAPTAWVFWLRWFGILGTVGLLYAGGLLIYPAADSIKTSVTDLADRGATKLEGAAASLTKQDLAGAREQFVAANNLFATAQREVLSLGQTNLYLSGLGDRNSQIVAGQKLIDSGVNLSQAGIAMIDAATPVLQYINGAAATQVKASDMPAQIVGLLSRNSKLFDRAAVRVAKADVLLQSIDPDRVGSAYSAAVINAQVKTAELQRLVDTFTTLAQELPAALGFVNPRQYILLNQNNNELRATGGFIGSFAVIKLYKGKIEEMMVDIPQRIDGQNPNPSLDIPEPLRAVATDPKTGQVAWGTRDANWYFDFPSSARTFQKLYEEAGGGTADGIIAITPDILRDLLAILGPVDLPSRNLQLTSGNVVDALQTDIAAHRSETNPKAILNDLAPVLLERLMGVSRDQLKQLQLTLAGWLAQKDILVYTRNLKLEQAIAGLNFAGTLPVGSGVDMLAVVRSNLGGTKTSQQVTEAIDHTARVNIDGSITDTVKLAYAHTGTSGINKEYIRLYLPKGAEIISAQGQDENTSFEAYEEGNNAVIAFWLTVPPQERRQVAISYKLPQRINQQYRLLVEKQPGTNNTRLTSTVKLSPVWRVVSSASTSQIQKLFDDKLSTDLDLSLDIAKVN